MGAISVRAIVMRGVDDYETVPAAEGELGSAHLPTLPAPSERKRLPKTAEHDHFDRDAGGRHLSQRRARFSRYGARRVAPPGHTRHR